MFRIPINERPDWVARAHEFGFKFHTIHGERYWDESAYYQFSLRQIEQDIEEPTAEIHQMCLAAVERVANDEELLKRFCIAPQYWDFVRQSWLDRQPSLYSRLDFAYDGKSPAKLYENNADCPTSLYETGFWQWLWLEDQVNAGHLQKHSDQFNSLQEKLVRQFSRIADYYGITRLHLASCKDTEEDRGTVQYLQDCASEAGLVNRFVFIEDIGLSDVGTFTDLQNVQIDTLFKLYPWEFMMDEEYGAAMANAGVNWLEPPWKSVLSNKALLPLLWQMFPEHPNLLPAFFEDELEQAAYYGAMVKKPIFSREGANVTIMSNSVDDGAKILHDSDGPYGQEGFIYQQRHLLPKFGDNYTLVGSWLVDDQPAGLSIREDQGPITQDTSRFLPHICV